MNGNGLLKNGSVRTNGRFRPGNLVENSTLLSNDARCPLYLLGAARQSTGPSFQMDRPTKDTDMHLVDQLSEFHPLSGERFSGVQC